MMFLPHFLSASYGQWRRHGATDDDDDNGDGATDNEGNGDDNGDGATNDNSGGVGATDDNDDNDNDGDDSNGAVADNNNVDNDDNDVDDIDDDNLPPRVGKRNDGCNETKTKEEETVGDTHNNQTDYREGGGRWRRIRKRR